ncbi:hypothetical protein JM79_3212 [Gramella sp. Hel_I_59]|uniref:hypothetical protein n=1 Tax=Gramella sp. Hel_I_59 TaxID=1249978 RepID=UPI00115442BE|nr:hypothetical protein [Gramella sp. Hel_I_59]TQI72255.1 hypothetical protein JM79_3212 [Gramella sp. Hel_I_59]
MKKSLCLVLLMLLSCSTNDLEQENMEMIDVFLHQPEIYYWFDASNPSQGNVEFNCNEGPYTVSVNDKTINVNAHRPVKKVLHLRGRYGNDAVEIELLTESSFQIEITDPDPYGETFRIFF